MGKVLESFFFLLPEKKNIHFLEQFLAKGPCANHLVGL